MFKLTPAAEEKIFARMEAEGKTDHALRVRIVGWTADDFEYRLEVLPESECDQGDVMVANGKMQVYIAADSVDKLRGAKLDYVDSARERGFKVENPNPVWTDERALAVQRVLDNEINPGVGMHGGRVKLLDVRDDVAYVEFGGGCVGCGMSKVTLKKGVTEAILENVPEINEVVDTTDHASGTNPYYKPEEVQGAESPVA